MRSLAPTKARRAAAGGGRHRQAVGGAGGVLHPRAGHRPRSSTCPATASPQAGGTAPAPAAWGCRAKHRWPGSRPCSRAATRRLASCWAAPMAATPCPPSTWSCGRPRASRSSTAWVTRRPAGRCWPPIMLGWPRRSAYLDEHLGARRGHGGVQHVSGQGLLAVGFDHRTSREGDPLLHTHLVVANRVQGPDGRWTALDGRDLYRHRLAADAIYRATYQRELSGRSGSSGRRPTPTATGSSRACPRSWSGCSPSAPTRSTWRWSGWRRTVGSGRRGWSSGPSTPPASPKSTRPRTPCMDAGGPRRPSGAWTRTPWSGR